MLRKPNTCNGCRLEAVNGGFSAPEGTGNNGVMIVGEALGEKEKAEGLPFRPYAEAGSILQSVLKRLNLNRKDFLLWNLIACQPPYNNLEGTDYEYEAINHCRVHFDFVMNKFNGKIKCILALGNLPMRHLAPDVMRMYQDAKDNKNKDLLKKLSITSLRGYKFESVYKNIPVVPSLHPSFIRRTGSIYSGVLLRDLYFALQVAKGNIQAPKIKYITGPSVDDALQFFLKCKNNPTKPISYDIETPHTIKETDETEVEYKDIEIRDIISIQFTINENEGIFLPWQEPFIEIAADILKLPNPKVSWNGWEFDNTHLRYHLGKDCINGLNIDAIWQWHHANPDFNKLGRGLQFVANFYAPNFPAWKHLSEENPKEYGITDVVVLNKIHSGLEKDLSSKKLLPYTKTLQEGFIDDIVKLKPILIDIENRGLPIDVVERDKFAKKLDKEIKQTMSRLQDSYPFELRNITPKEGYKFVPKEIEELTEKFNELYRDPNNTSNSFFVFSDANSSNLAVSQFIEKNSRIKSEDGKKDNSGLILREFQFNGDKEKRWCRFEKFKPRSREQVIAYIKFKGYKVPVVKDFKKGDRETTRKDEISQLADETGDTFLNDIRDIRELHKMRVTYVGKGKKGWKLGADGRVHTHFKFLGSTGQLTSTDPNIQNAPSHGNRFSSKGYKELATEFRKLIAAAPGKVILSADWSSFHALTLGFESEDPAYMRTVRCDIHSFVTAHMLNTELPRWYNLIRVKKPLEIEKKDWMEKCSKYEEGLYRLKTLHNWLSLSDEDLKEHLGWFKKNFKYIRDTQAKNAILGMGFGMGVGHFFNTFRYAFQRRSEPEALLKLIKKLFPKTFVDYHENTRNLADQQSYLISRYGYIRRFYDVYDWRLISKPPKVLREGQKLVRYKNGQLWLRKDGQDSNAAIAFNPANDAFGKKKEAMRDLYALDNYKSFGLINEIHDDLMFEVEEEKVKEFAPIIKEIMESPARMLKNKICPEGLICKIELKVGKNWGEMEKLEL